MALQGTKRRLFLTEGLGFLPGFDFYGYPASRAVLPSNSRSSATLSFLSALRKEVLHVLGDGLTLVSKHGEQHVFHDSCMDLCGRLANCR